ncbi:YbaN family protein [Siccirubricoccus sp. G192]|uniref:YbaN family protein n=1 Tax=Siccirubricoccus sp. G192 TaxID=2849651 RepID=UPI001C2C000D|nr:YbaN family protein [Siccirubricoccus sp. G192]MBV1797609.1 YbaN family protein [Siccirubricoccus sp. G192]
MGLRRGSNGAESRRPQRVLLLGAGYASLALAAIGAVLPLMPTTVFLLIAAWCFGRASPALRQRLLSHPRFGGALRDWEQHGAISPRAKRAAVLAMALSWMLVVLAFRDPVASALAGGCMALVGIFIVTRPSRPGQRRRGGQG